MDKNKIIESAAKLVAKGAYDKAIKEYQRALEVDPKDVRVLQKMGELFQKKNDNAQAAVYFTKVAESYSTDGFFLKAVALYKQVLKLNPNLVDVNLKLAELHQQLGLMSEAMAYFQIVANAYDKAGDTKSSLDTLKKMVDLDPENIASRIKLAELYARENMNREATTEFKRAADYLKRNNRADDYIRVAERLSALEPDNLVLAKELASNFLAKGDQKRALAKLQICFKADSRDVDTLTLLAQAFQGLGQTSKTISVYKELAKIYGEKGQANEANQVWAKVQQLDPNDAELQARRTGASPAAPAAAAPRPAAAAPSAPQTGQRPAAAAAPSAPPAAPRPAAAAAPASGPEQLVKLLTETEVYVKYGLHDKALEHLRKVFAIDPESLDAHEKAYNIYVAAGNQAQAGEQLLNVLRLCTRRRDVSRAQQYLDIILQQNPRHPEVPAFLAALRPAGGPADAEVAEEAILMDSGDEEIVVAEAPEDALAGTTSDDLAINAVATDEEDVIAEERVILGDDEADTTNPFASDVVSDEPFGEPDTLAGVPDEPLFDAADSEIIVEGEEEEQPTKEGPLPVGLLAQATRPSPATVAVTVPTYKRPPPAPAPAPAPAAPARAPAPPTAAARPAPKVEPPKKPAPPPAAPARAPVAAKAPPPKPKPVDPVAEELDEAGFFLDQGQLDAAREVLETVLVAYPNHSRAKELMGRLEAMEQPAEAPESAGGRDAFDLAAELAGDFTEIGSEDIVDSPSAAGNDFQYSVEEVFSEFKKGLQKVVKPEDVETHYDLGIAYKEMGLMDDAIGEFNVAREGCAGKKKEVDCLTMIGLLQTMKGDHAAAVGSFKEALTSEHAIGETLKATEFELASAQEAMGDAGRALYHFQRVAKLDPGYREVGEIVARLSATTRPVDDPIGPKGGGANGANGAHGGGKPGPGGGKPGGGPSGPSGKPPEKSRKVGYV